jgi:hypothetical protein
LQGALTGAIVALTNDWLHKPGEDFTKTLNRILYPKKYAGEMLKAPVKTTKIEAKKQEAKGGVKV